MFALLVAVWPEKNADLFEVALRLATQMMGDEELLIGMRRVANKMSQGRK
jgi:hypothetical protein